MNKIFNPANMLKLDSEDRKKSIQPEKIIELIDIKEGDTILDIGAGIGLFTLPALSKVGTNGRVIATDISKEMLEELKRRLPEESNNAELIHCDAIKIPLPDKSVDKIILSFVFHEFDDRAEYLTEISRLIKDKGTMIILEWDMVESPSGPPLEERIKQEELLEITKPYGFYSDLLKKINDYQYLAVLKKK